MNRVLIPTLFAFTLAACGPEQDLPDWKPPPPDESTLAPRDGDEASTVEALDLRFARPLPQFLDPIDRPAAAEAHARWAFARVEQLEAMPDAWGSTVVDLVRLATELSGSEGWTTTGTLFAPSEANDAWRWAPEPSHRFEVRTRRETLHLRIDTFEVEPGLSWASPQADHALAFEVSNGPLNLKIASRRKGWELSRKVDGVTGGPGSGCGWTLSLDRVSVGPGAGESSLDQQTRAEVVCGALSADFQDRVNWQFGADERHSYDLTRRTMTWSWRGPAGNYALRDGELVTGYSSQDGAVHTASGNLEKGGWGIGELVSEEVGRLNAQKVRQAFLVAPGFRLAVGPEHASNH